MAPKKKGSQRFAEYEEKLVKDYDPEANPAAAGTDDDSQSGDSDDGLGGTEHYVSVGKSKLRQPDTVSLGPQYRGRRVSRSALDESSENDEEDDDDESEDGDESESEDFADPETADLEADQVEDDDEIDSDDALCPSDEEKFAKFAFRGSSKPKVDSSRRSKRPIAADFLSSSEEEEDPESYGSDDGGKSTTGDDTSEDDEEELGSDDASASDEDETDADDDEEDDSDDETGRNKGEDPKAGDLSAQARQLIGGDTSQGQGGAMLSEGAAAAVEKGRAVRQQRRSFDSILNIRIRLQKALVAANSLSVVPDDDAETVGDEPYQAAEEAALKLWDTIENFRRSLAPASSSSKGAGAKRKREVTLDTPLSELWDEMQTIEARAASNRKKILEKWSKKTKSANPVAAKRQLGSNATESLTSFLEGQLASSDRLVQRTRIPRSCAPLQASKKVQEDENIYDDADFYQLLLKELVDQRTLDTSAGAGSGPTVKWAAVKEARTRKVVDRRASKGRKLRFTVHEKLQNFMAPEDRRSWEQDAIDRFFGTLFGQKMELGEDADEGSEDEEMGGVSVQDQGLRLFG